MKAESFGGSEMNGGIQVMTRRTQRIVATCATAVMLLAATGAMAAQFTVGNVIVASTPNTASNQVITVAEYTSAAAQLSNPTRSLTRAPRRLSATTGRPSSDRRSTSATTATKSSTSRQHSPTAQRLPPASAA